MHKVLPPRERYRRHTNRSRFNVERIPVVLGVKNEIFHAGTSHEIRWVLFRLIKMRVQTLLENESMAFFDVGCWPWMAEGVEDFVVFGV